ncbi:hypothetical protein BCEP4_1250062 [Burkholderia cepacia]|nr:hypothetical protein BCEP4_1250062 [Burkholderia cepacia]
MHRHRFVFRSNCLVHELAFSLMAVSRYAADNREGQRVGGPPAWPYARDRAPSPYHQDDNRRNRSDR